MDVWPAVVASASVIALLAMLGWRAQHGAVEDQLRLRSVLLGAVALIIIVALIAMAWTLIRSS